MPGPAEGGGEAAATQQSPPSSPAPAEPTGLYVPEVDLASELLHLGLRSDGSAEVPQDFDLASWYTESGRPGEDRPTVLLGHVDSVDGPAVFARLHELDAGALIEMETAGGNTVQYEVTRTATYPKNEFPTFDVFSGAGDDVLRLVTCTGDFDPAERSYQNNLVVYAEHVDSGS